MLYLCHECGGAGAIAFERGPAAENCTRCNGVGVIMSDTRTAIDDLRRLFSVSPADEGTLARAAPGVEWRLVAEILQHLERRIDALEL